MNHICNSKCQSYNCYYDNSTIQGIMLMEHLMADTLPESNFTQEEIEEAQREEQKQADADEAYQRAMGILGGIK